MRKMALGAAVIVLFGVAAAAAVWFLTRDEGAAATAGREAAPSLSAVEPGGAPVGLPPSATVPPPPPLLVKLSDPPVEPPKDSWEAVPVVARASALGPLGGVIGRGLIELQPRLAACFDEDTAARFGPTPPVVAQDASISDTGATVLVLQIEVGGGEARIVDAPVDAQGGASDGVVTCAQSVLRGQRFAYPQASPRGKYRLLHPLSR